MAPLLCTVYPADSRGAKHCCGQYVTAPTLDKDIDRQKTAACDAMGGGGGQMLHKGAWGWHVPVLAALVQHADDFQTVQHNAARRTCHVVILP